MSDVSTMNSIGTANITATAIGLSAGRSITGACTEVWALAPKEPSLVVDPAAGGAQQDDHACQRHEQQDPRHRGGVAHVERLEALLVEPHRVEQRRSLRRAEDRGSRRGSARARDVRL